MDKLEISQTLIMPYTNNPITLQGITNVKKIITGGNHIYVIDDNNNLKGYGNDFSDTYFTMMNLFLGRLRLAEIGLNLEVINIHSVDINISNVLDVYAGSGHAVAILNDGIVKSWGLNYVGQLGDKTRQYRAQPVTITMQSIN
ncbi:Regulator of chromosome condensation (RCC1) repeat protein [compost metagenome]